MLSEGDMMNEQRVIAVTVHVLMRYGSLLFSRKLERPAFIVTFYFIHSMYFL